MKEVSSSMNVMYDINPNAVKASMDSYDLARVIPLEGLNKKLSNGTRTEGYSYSRMSEGLYVSRHRVLSSFDKYSM